MDFDIEERQQVNNSKMLSEQTQLQNDTLNKCPSPATRLTQLE